MRGIDRGSSSSGRGSLLSSMTSGSTGGDGREKGEDCWSDASWRHSSVAGGIRSRVRQFVFVCSLATPREKFQLYLWGIMVGSAHPEDVVTERREVKTY